MSVNNNTLFDPTFLLRAPYAIADSGASDILLRESDATRIKQDTSIPNIHVVLPNGQTLQSIAAGNIRLPNMPNPFRVYIFRNSDLRQSLFGLSPLCAQGCNINFTYSTVTVTINGAIVLKGQRPPTDSLWTFPLPVPSIISNDATANAVISIPSDAAFIRFAHATLGSSTISTLLRALRAGYLQSFPRLTAQLVSSHPPNTIPTAKGHLDQHRQGIDSTTNSDIDTSATHVPASSHESHTVYVKIILASDTSHSDLTGRFPIASITGNQYLFISTMDGYIHAEPMTSRHHTEYLKAYQKTIDFFRSHGHPISIQRLDNETSSQLEKIQTQKITIQFCPPANHRALHAERAIRTYKNHFIATLATTAIDFPLNLCDKLLPQIEICLNHLLPFKPNPSVSAYAGIRGGPYDFRAHPIAPLGTKVLIHDKSAYRTTWAAHGVPGYYIGPALKHYRCFQAWAISSQSARVTDTLAWFPAEFSMPEITPIDCVTAAVADLSRALHSLLPPPLQFSTSAQPHPLIASIVREIHEVISMYTPGSTQFATSLPSPSTLSSQLPPQVQRVPTTPTTP